MVSAAADGLADMAARRLREMGYTDVRVLDGGIEAWERAGYHLFGGIHVPSKAFGELVEQRCETPAIDAKELKSLMDSGRDIAVFDSRPSHEYRRMNIPSARNCPGAELVYRLPGLVPSRDTLVVVNCAGRTRSIIGAQSLINAGFPNRVVALRNGTMGWHLAGLTLQHGHSDLVQEPGPEGMAAAQRMAQGVRERFGIGLIGMEALERLRAEADNKTLYVLDVRSQADFEAGHLAGSRCAPGGQLVQTTDVFIGTRNARIVLVDSHGVRATMTASWLLQMGWPDVSVLAWDDPALAFDQRGLAPMPWSADLLHDAEISPTELQRALQTGEAHLLDLAHSELYKTAHIPGARFALRSRFPTSLPSLETDRMLVLASDDGQLAHAAARDAAAAFRGPVRVLAGGTHAWKAVDLPLVPGFDAALDPAEDLWQIPYLRGAEAMREYLSWEVDLMEKVAGEPGVRFHVGPRAATVLLRNGVAA